MTNSTLAAIHIHPVKSCRRIEMEQAVVSPMGIAGDRLWQIVDDNGHPLTQRHHKVLAAVQPELIDDGLRLTAPGQDVIEIASPGSTDAEVKSLLGVTVAAYDAGDDAARWFGDLIGQECRLVGIADGPGWRLPSKFGLYDQSMAFTDAAPVLITTTSSLSWLQANASEPFGIERFRPNLVIQNDTPWVEDTWQDFEIGDAGLTAGMPWPRCTVPQIDQNRVEDLDIPRYSEPAKVLREHRWCTEAPTMAEPVRPFLEGNGLFGIGCSIGPAGTVLRVGDPVTVTSTAAPVITPP